MTDDELNRRELTGDDALRLARESGMEEASRCGVFYAGVGDLIRFARLVRAGWSPDRVPSTFADPTGTFADKRGTFAEQRRLNCGDPVPKRVCYSQTGCVHATGEPTPAGVKGGGDGLVICARTSAPGQCLRVQSGLARCLHGCSFAPTGGVPGTSSAEPRLGHPVHQVCNGCGAIPANGEAHAGTCGVDARPAQPKGDPTA